MQQFDAIFKIFGRAVFEAIEVKGHSMLHFVFFIVPQRITLVSKAKRKIWKSSILELCNRLSHRGLSYSFEVGSQLSEMITKIRCCNLKIQHWTSFDLNGLKNDSPKNFENSLKSKQIFQILMKGMNFRERSQKTQMSSAVRSAIGWAVTPLSRVANWNSIFGDSIFLRDSFVENDKNYLKIFCCYFWLDL